MQPILRRAFVAASLTTALFAALPAHAADVAGVRFDDRSTVAGSDLALNGAGLRTRFMLKVYAMGLYLPRRADTPDTIATLAGPKRIQIVTLRDLTAEQFADALVGLRPVRGAGRVDAGDDASGAAHPLLTRQPAGATARYWPV